MSSVATLRSHLQSVLDQRGWSDLNLRPATVPEVVSCGVPELDQYLCGGFPRGALTEICGLPSSGRTSLMHAFLAQITQRQEVCALVDVSDVADPESLAAAGVDLRRLLWVRCGGKNIGTGEIQRADAVQASISRNKLGLSGGRPRHPREEVRGLDTAMSFLLEPGQAKLMGVSARSRPVLSVRGAPEEFAVVARCSGEQVTLDRQAPRRADYFLKQHQAGAISPARPAQPEQSARVNLPLQEKPWRRVEQALKAADLLLNGGGFGAVVLDLGDIPWVDARRVPLTSWFRFRRAVESTPTILVLLAEDSCARTCASLVLRCERGEENWKHAALRESSRPCATLQGFTVRGELLRARRMQGPQLGQRISPACSPQWKTQTLWSG